MAQYQHKVKDTIKYYKKKGVKQFIVCIGEPINRTIKYEVKDLHIEDFFEEEYCDHQSFIKKTPDGSVMILLLTLHQLHLVYGNCDDRLIPSQHKCGPMIKSFKVLNDTFSKTLPIGYCHHNTHDKYVTKTQMVTQRCLEKNCPYFERYNSHFYWTEEIAVAKKKQQLKKDRQAQKEQKMEELMRKAAINVAKRKEGQK